MKHNESAQTRQMCAQWAKAGPALEAIRRGELAAFDHARDWRLVDGLLAAGWRPDAPERASGLVEMERWLRKAYAIRAA
jgi:hypothetical protein